MHPSLGGTKLSGVISQKSHFKRDKINVPSGRVPYSMSADMTQIISRPPSHKTTVSDGVRLSDYDAAFER